jgi:hypothetical protein
MSFAYFFEKCLAAGGDELSMSRLPSVSVTTTNYIFCMVRYYKEKKITKRFSNLTESPGLFKTCLCRCLMI